MKKRFIITAVLAQLVLIAVFVFLTMSAKPQMKWDAEPIYVPNMQYPDLYAMLPVKDGTTNAQWYIRTLTRVSGNYIKNSGALEIKHEILTDTSSLLKYRLYNEQNDTEWIVWVDLLPLRQKNTEPRVAVQYIR